MSSYVSLSCEVPSVVSSPLSESAFAVADSRISLVRSVCVEPSFAPSLAGVGLGALLAASRRAKASASEM